MSAQLGHFMTATAYYNEIDPYKAAWIRNLIKAGEIAPGVVDTRSIEDVHPDELREYTQCHFFAGVGIWSYALRKAGWPDDYPVWTGSCPCQPFSAAGSRKGSDDSRHLWPAFFRLIEARRPAIVFGEQVSSIDALGTDQGADVQELWRREGTLRVLKNWLERNISNALQSVSQRPSPRTGSQSSFFDLGAGQQARSFGQTQSKGEEPSVRSDQGADRSKADTGCLRGDGNTVRSASRPGLEHTLSGQDRPSSWLHHFEHEGGSLGVERRLRGLGSGQDASDRLQNLRAAATEIGAAVASTRGAIDEKDGGSWINSVQADLEEANYSVGTNDLCGAGVGAPHIRQRLYWVAHLGSEGLEGFPWDGDRAPRWPSPPRSAAACSCSGGLADCTCGRPQGGDLGCAYPRTVESPANGKQGGLADNGGLGRRVKRRSKKRGEPDGCGPVDSDGRSPVAGFWRAADWLHCRDAKWRPVEPGSFPMAHELAPNMGCDSSLKTSPYREEGPWRKGMIHGYGDGIIAEVAIEFISAFLDVHKQDGLSRLGN